MFLRLCSGGLCKLSTYTLCFRDEDGKLVNISKSKRFGSDEKMVAQDPEGGAQTP